MVYSLGQKTESDGIMKEILTAIGKEFRLPGYIIAYDVEKRGNINCTYRVKYRLPDGKVKYYIFQKINTYVFKNPEEIMANIDLVTTHIQGKKKDAPTLYFYHTKDRKNYVYDVDGGFWRVMNYVDSITFNSCENLDVIQATGEAFGEFQMQLADLDGSRLYETIPDFHNTEKRLNTLFDHVAADELGRVASVKKEIDYIASVREKATELSRRYNRGELPVRVTHNDTKANNVLFDKVNFKPLVVIDLDTVMPGMSMYDFGDAIRFIANTAEEDEPDLSKVSLDVSKFMAFSRGFIGKAKNSLTKAELDNMVLAAFSISVELASRFLDDYITGDKYFKILYPEHNIDRTRCQLHLAKDIERKFDVLQTIVREITK